MTRMGWGIATLLAASVAASVGAREPVRLRDVTSDPAVERHRLAKVVVVGISDNRETRNRFEDKLVSRLRSRGVASSASHVSVPDLTRLPSRDEILRLLEADGVDAIVTVRTVGTDTIGDDGWTAAWNAWIGGAPTARALVESSVPVPKEPAKRYGVEFVVWDVKTSRLVWAARSGPYPWKDLRSGVSDLLEAVLDGLEDARWL